MEAVRRAVAEVQRCGEELRAEREVAEVGEKGRRELEQRLREMQERLDQAEQMAMKSGKKIVMKLEHRVN